METDKIMKKIRNTITAIGYSLLVFVAASCSDMLETESTRQNFDPDMGEKTDSLFYVYGIMQAMQQLADQYVFTGELRGDLVKTTQYADSMLTQLANFNVTTSNRYDSAYVYYRVINNCNYYIEHRSTDLYTGAQNVSIAEYAAVKAYRAWAYLQLARNYGKVPFFTEPLTQISQINESSFPELNLEQIVAQLAPDLEQYVAMPTPTAGAATHQTVAPNWESTKKSYAPGCCYIPVGVILGDMYLEVGDYDKAAKAYVTYLTKVAKTTTSSFVASYLPDKDYPVKLDETQVAYYTPAKSEMGSWQSIFSRNSSDDIVSYIPMAANSQNGPTTVVPLAFGADYYATPDEQTGYTRRNSMNINGDTHYWAYHLPLVTNVQIIPSDSLVKLSKSVEYFYYGDDKSTNYDNIKSAAIGDMRLNNTLSFYTVGDNSVQWITKYDFANIILYRNSTVLLHLAEAFNRLGMCDVAFAILKDGISEVLTRPSTMSNSASYMTDESRNLIQTTYPLLKDSFLTRFPLETACGIHCHGAGKAVSDMALKTYLKDSSPYQYDAVIGKKLAEIDANTDYGVTVGTTKQDTINAVEDLLCDEYALELAFEGTRYHDLMRLARHKNGGSGAQYDGSPSNYGAQFGYKWIQEKLKGRGWNQSTMYLPFK